jgi:hypothetical protein
MRNARASYVTLCQQALVFAVVLAFLIPALLVVSMDVDRAKDQPQEELPTKLKNMSSQGSLLPAASVSSHLKRYPLLTPTGSPARTVSKSNATLTSAPLPITGYGGVGVTWDSPEAVTEDDIAIHVRSQQAGTWGNWQSVAYHDEHGPDPDSPEGKRAKGGTDLIFVGDVDQVQVRVRGVQPPGLTAAIVTPQEPAKTMIAGPELDMEGPTEITDAESPEATADASLKLQAGQYTSRPKIYSRAQWGADERIRDRVSLRYFEVHTGFVHHTVTANTYSRAEVPGILQGIYKYHVSGRGWSDIGYNFLIDRFGRIWEGRYGGIWRPVVGAHTLNYNDYAFGASAIGNFDVTRPSAAMVNAYSALFGWKLSLHGVGANTTKTINGAKFYAINGHRDAASTACPGRFLYARLADIRRGAAAVQQSWDGRQRETNLAGGPGPDLIVRRASDGRGFILPIKGSPATLGSPIDTGSNFKQADLLLNVGDWDRDGNGDLIIRTTGGSLLLRLGNGNGTFAGPRRIGSGFDSVRLLAAVGDMTGDGFPDLMGQPARRAMRIYPGAGTSGLRESYVAYSGISSTLQLGMGRMNRDGAPDSIFRVGSRLVMYPGNGPGGLVAAPVTYATEVTRYDRLVAVSDVYLTGHSDLVARDRRTGGWYLLSGSKTGFGSPQLLGGGGNRYNLVGR